MNNNLNLRFMKRNQNILYYFDVYNITELRTAHELGYRLFIGYDPVISYIKLDINAIFLHIP